MRVILLADVERVGHEGDVVEVRDGYARNYLIPRGLATKATPGALRDLELRRDAIDKRHLQRREAAAAVAERVKDRPITLEVVVGERGRLHGRVTTAQLAQVLRDQFGITVDRRNIELHEPIRAVGDYLISVRLFSDVVVNLQVQVRPLGAEAEEHYTAPRTPEEVAAEVPDSADATEAEPESAADEAQ
ncbi:MAG: 50S ribosomal protein L9 [Armatimonadetes bacterium]|nr:50S ribosomal protein L9 [Armatimonadota bacterium]